MNNKDEDLKKALDELFGDDVENIKTEEKGDFEDSLGDTTYNENNIIDTSLDSNADGINLNVNEEEETKIQDGAKDTINSKRIFAYLFIGFIIGLTLLFLVIDKQDVPKNIVYCSHSKEDTGYKEMTEYKITKKDDVITFVEGTYTYVAKTDEYKTNIDKVKEEKIPVIINSNGMSGFTYSYEISDNLFKIDSYLDYELFDETQVKDALQKGTPISFYPISLEKKYLDLKKVLEKSGFKCTTSY